MQQDFASRLQYARILIREFVISDFKIRYQGSVLGYAWALLRPLMMYIILYVIFFYFLKIGQGVKHWPPALMAGLVIWSFFAEVTKQGLTSIVGHGAIMRKMNFPRYTIIVAASMSALINLLINMLVVLIFMFADNVGLSWGFAVGLLYILEIFIFGIGVALILSTIYVRYRDINFIWDVVTQALFYGSAVLYPVSRISSVSLVAAQVLLLNPVANGIQSFRKYAISQDTSTIVDLSSNVIVQAGPHIITVVVFIYGVYLFSRSSPRFAEEV